MEETTMQVVDSEKFMRHYSMLSQNKLEEHVSRSYAAKVQKEVRDAQDRADQIVNALTSRSKPPDFKVARAALGLLASAPDVVVAHWQPFIASIAEVLPAREDGEVEDVKVVDTAAESEGLKDLRATLGRIASVLPLGSARELREMAMGFKMLGDAIGAEFAKRGMAFEHDGAAAVLERLDNELAVAVKAEPLPKDFAFSDKRVMELRAIADSQRMQLLAADAEIARLKDQATATVTDASDAEAKVRGLEAQVAALTTERDAVMQTRLEMSQAADKQAALAAEMQKLHAEESQRNTDLEVKLTEAKKRQGELEHEVEQLKKKSKR